jgi:hypothetical protein
MTVNLLAEEYRDKKRSMKYDIKLYDEGNKIEKLEDIDSENVDIEEALE